MFGAHRWALTDDDVSHDWISADHVLGTNRGINGMAYRDVGSVGYVTTASDG
jgi:hypothetical protein